MAIKRYLKSPANPEVVVCLSTVTDINYDEPLEITFNDNGEDKVWVFASEAQKEAVSNRIAKFMDTDDVAPSITNSLTPLAATFHIGDSIAFDFLPNTAEYTLFTGSLPGGVVLHDNSLFGVFKATGTFTFTVVIKVGEKRKKYPLTITVEA